MESNKAKERYALHEVFRVAWNNAIGAALNRREDEDRCLDALTRLKTLPVSIDVLDSTTVAMSINCLRKHSNVRIQKLSREIIQEWDKKRFVQISSSKSEKSGITTLTSNAKPKKSGVGNVQNRTALFSKVNYHSFKIQKEKPKCNDSFRDKVREQIHKGLCMVLKEASHHVISNASDPAQVAESLESELFLKWGLCKNKYRSLLFNLKDPKNPDFRRKILVGEISAKRVAMINALEMASNARKEQNKNIEAKALNKCIVSNKQYNPSLQELQQLVC